MNNLYSQWQGTVEWVQAPLRQTGVVKVVFQHLDGWNDHFVVSL
jgi:hypothetical protein